MKIISEWAKPPMKWAQDGNTWRRVPGNLPSGHKMVMAIVNGKTQHVAVPK